MERGGDMRVRPRSAAAMTDTRPVTEAELQRAVIDLARSLGWGTTVSAHRRLVAEAAQYGVEPPPLDGLIFHPKWSIGSEAGWPDLTLIRRVDRRLVFAELKTEKGRLSDRQVEVLDLLRVLVDQHLDPVRGDDGAWRPERRGSRLEVHVWRPSDLASGAITEVLR